MRLLARTASIVLAILLAPGLAFALPPVWVVKAGDSTITLFGSVHLLPPGVDWRPPALKEALAGADEVWFEAPMDPAGLAEATQAAQEHALLPTGEHLSDLLSVAGRTRLETVANKFGLTPEQLDRLQPWYAELLIQSATFERIGVKSTQGVELQLWAGVSPTARRVALETPAQQVGFFSGASLKDQVASLEETLTEVGHAQRDYDDLLKAWLNGDVRRLDRHEVAPLRKAAPGLYVRVVQERNQRWLKVLQDRLKAPGHTVVVVGVGHLVGPDGLPTQLRAHGYKVEGPS